MTRVLVILVTTLLAATSFASGVAVECQSETLGKILIQNKAGACNITLQLPNYEYYRTANAQCSEVWDGEKYTIYSNLGNLPFSELQPAIKVLRRTTSDIYYVSVKGTDAGDLLVVQGLECTAKSF